MTDLDNLRAMLDHAGVPYGEGMSTQFLSGSNPDGPSITIGGSDEDDPFVGYIPVEFSFTTDGQLARVWELE